MQKSLDEKFEREKNIFYLCPEGHPIPDSSTRLEYVEREGMRVRGKRYESKLFCIECDSTYSINETSEIKILG